MTDPTPLSPGTTICGHSIPLVPGTTVTYRHTSVPEPMPSVRDRAAAVLYGFDEMLARDSVFSDWPEDVADALLKAGLLREDQ